MGTMPSPTVEAVREPAGPGVRIDGSLERGLDVSPLYDSLLAKLVVWAEDRPATLERMYRALGEYGVLGVRTTIPFHRWLMRHPPFVAGDLDTELVARDWPPAEEPDLALVERAAILAAVAEHLGRAKRQPVSPGSAEDVGRWLSFARRAGLRVP